MATANYIQYNGDPMLSVGPVAPNGNQAVTTPPAGTTSMTTLGGYTLPTAIMNKVTGAAVPNAPLLANSQVPANWQGLSPELIDYLTKEKAAAVYDGGIEWAYDPATQTFNGRTLGGTQTMSLADMTQRANQTPTQTTNNVGTGYNFTPTPINQSGSYNSEDWATLIGGLLTGGTGGALSAAGINEAIARLQALGESGLTDYTNLAKEVTKDVTFKPYTITSSVGTTQETAPGVITQTLTPEQQANVNKATALQGQLYGATLPDTTALTTGALTGAETQLGAVGAGQEDLAALRAGYGAAAQGMTGMLGGSTTDMANTLFAQQQAMRDPEQQRKALELENRLRAQGRLGTTTAAYGGTPEQLAMAKAIQEQQAADAFTSMTQAEQMATSQQARALGLGTATSDIARVQQALKTGDIANAQGLFNIGSAAAQLPQLMRGQNISQAGQLLTQALTPADKQAAQLTAAGTLAGQKATTAATAGRLFGDLATTGLQERLTAESAAAATRTKQYDAALSALASQGGATGTAANTVRNFIDQGITKIGNELYNAAGQLLGPAIDVIGEAASNLWDSLTVGDYPAGNNPDEVAGGIISDIGNGLADIVSDGIDVITDTAKEILDWF